MAIVRTLPLIRPALRHLAKPHECFAHRPPSPSNCCASYLERNFLGDAQRHYVRREQPYPGVSLSHGARPLPAVVLRPCPRCCPAACPGTDDSGSRTQDCRTDDTRTFPQGSGRIEASTQSDGQASGARASATLHTRSRWCNGSTPSTRARRQLGHATRIDARLWGAAFGGEDACAPSCTRARTACKCSSSRQVKRRACESRQRVEAGCSCCKTSRRVHCARRTSNPGSATARSVDALPGHSHLEKGSNAKALCKPIACPFDTAGAYSL